MNEWIVPGYTEIRELGHGGSGRVMLASHDESGTPVAIKYLADDLVDSFGFVDDFRAEAEILNDLHSPYVTRLYEYLESGGHAAIVMELVDGVSMRSMLREQGPLEPEAALVILQGSLRGLADAHGRKVVHRDYKPANILVDTAGRSKLADFGIAVRKGRLGILAGTPSYMAPEQWAGTPATPQTDIYAATATFFECLTGHPPFVAPGDRDRLRQLHEHEPVPAAQAPESVRDLLHWGMAKQAAQRPRNATVFLRELERTAGDAYGADWEVQGRRQLARRVLLLAALLPRPSRPQPGAATSASFAWTRLGKRATSLLIALIVVLAAIVVARVALADASSGTSVAGPAESASLPATVLGSLPPVAAPPGPSTGPVSPPSAPASPSPSPSVSHTPKKKKPNPPPPPPPPASTSPSASASPSAPPPVPTFGALVLNGNVFYEGSCQCWEAGWSATARASGNGKATLHVDYYPSSSATGGQSSTPSKSWDLDFTVTDGGSTSWNDQDKYAASLSEACGRYDEVTMTASITAGGKTAITAKPQTVSCQIIT